MMADRDDPERAARELAERLEGLLARLDALPEHPARAVALEAVESVVQLYGEGLARIVEIVAASDDPALARRFAGDALVAHLLLLHGLHPDDTTVRVQRALDEVAPYLEAHGRAAELVSVDGDVARVRLTGTGHGCASTARTVRAAVEEAVLGMAPELARVEAEDGAQRASALVTIAGPRGRTAGGAPR